MNVREDMYPAQASHLCSVFLHSFKNKWSSLGPSFEKFFFVFRKSNLEKQDPNPQLTTRAFHSSTVSLTLDGNFSHLHFTGHWISQRLISK